MAVYTTITIDDLRAHTQQFDIGAVVKLTPIMAGISNTNYHLETTAGQYILTIFEARTDTAALPFIFDYMAHLRKAGTPVAEVKADKLDLGTFTLKNKTAAIVSFLQGQSVDTPSIAHVEAFAQLQAAMHLTAESFSAQQKNTMGIDTVTDLIAVCGSRVDTIEAGLQDLLSDSLNKIKLPTDAATLPRGAVHADLFPDNVFFKDGKINGVIDFYFSCTDYFIYDLMLSYNAWCFDAVGNLNPLLGAAYLQAYQKTRPLTQGEKKYLQHMGMRAALRIVATRLYDALNPVAGAMITPKNPLPYIKILQYHRRYETS